MLWCHAAPQLFIGLTPNSTRVKFNMKATERVAQKEKRIGGFCYFFPLAFYEGFIDGNGRQMAMNKYAGQIWGLEPSLPYP